MKRKSARTWQQAQVLLGQRAASGPCLLERGDELPVIAEHGRVLEAILLPGVAYLVLRQSRGRGIWRMDLATAAVKRASVEDYLRAEERLAALHAPPGCRVADTPRPVDFAPCFDGFPRRDGPAPALEGPWPDALEPLLATSVSHATPTTLASSLRRLLAARDIAITPAVEELLERVEQRGDAHALGELLDTLPLVRTLVMVSVHGWFSQHGVLGKPDTGGQVTYVLEQARCLEQAMRARHEATRGTDMPRVVILTRLIPDAEDTACDQEFEKIHDTVDSWIVRVPFRHPDGSLVRPWLSRFAIVPYLETFAAEAAGTLERFLGRVPELVVGHYTDGNLAAMYLRRHWDNLHAACVHLLERTKHRPRTLLFSSATDQDTAANGAAPEQLAAATCESLLQQSLADVWGYNSADFILSSTRREVQFDGPAESPDAPGMLESYAWFTIPGQFRVTGGIDPTLARHYVAPPGVDTSCFHVDERPEVVGCVDAHAADPVVDCLRSLDLVARPTPLARPGRPWIFAIARIDPAKNLSGLVDAYGRCDALRQRANLLLVSSTNDWRSAGDDEERREAQRIETLLRTHRLTDEVLWLGARLTRPATGRLFRAVARSRGVFAQPARFETFGLTVLEAMACGLPVVATCHGGPAEILRDGEDGELADPADPQAFAAALLRLLDSPERWQACSLAGPRRVAAAYSWQHHGRSLLALAGLHALLREIAPDRRARFTRLAPPFPYFARPTPNPRP